MATTCFAKAGDTYWESYAKASGLRATADRLQGSNFEKSRIALSQAAEIFQSIDKAELAAHCYFELHEYERAGTNHIAFRIFLAFNSFILPHIESAVNT